MVTFAALVEEIGELSREINHRYSDKKKRGEEVAYVNEEMGDVLFTLICLANQLEVDLENQLDETLRKWSRRQEA
jgi:NTP pyrophosphatase (non-canonical NTP hydrolase)